jgi:hypothetical protein
MYLIIDLPVDGVRNSVTKFSHFKNIEQHNGAWKCSQCYDANRLTFIEGHIRPIIMNVQKNY